MTVQGAGCCCHQLQADGAVSTAGSDLSFTWGAFQAADPADHSAAAAAARRRCCWIAVEAAAFGQRTRRRPAVTFSAVL